MTCEKPDIPVYVALTKFISPNSTPFHVGHCILSTMQSFACQWTSQLCIRMFGTWKLNLSD